MAEADAPRGGLAAVAARQFDGLVAEADAPRDGLAAVAAVPCDGLKAEATAPCDGLAAEAARLRDGMAADAAMSRRDMRILRVRGAREATVMWPPSAGIAERRDGVRATLVTQGVQV